MLISHLVTVVMHVQLSILAYYLNPIYSDDDRLTAQNSECSLKQLIQTNVCLFVLFLFCLFVFSTEVNESRFLK